MCQYRTEQSLNPHGTELVENQNHYNICLSIKKVLDEMLKLAKPKKRLCIGSMTNMVGASKYGSFKR